jgi:PhnB protein
VIRSTTVNLYYQKKTKEDSSYYLEQGVKTPCLGEMPETLIALIKKLNIKENKMTTINPYLNFGGNCEEAFNFYKSVFGGEFLTVMRFKDSPPELNMPKDEGEKVMHVALPVGKNTLMGSDVPSSMGPMKDGSNYISISADSEDEATRLFNSLSKGGKVTMPLDKAFWGAYFGMCTDKFGTKWMVSHDSRQS